MVLNIKQTCHYFTAGIATQNPQGFYSCLRSLLMDFINREPFAESLQRAAAPWGNNEPNIAVLSKHLLCRNCFGEVTEQRKKALLLLEAIDQGPINLVAAAVAPSTL